MTTSQQPDERASTGPDTGTTGQPHTEATGPLQTKPGSPPDTKPGSPSDTKPGSPSDTKPGSPPDTELTSPSDAELTSQTASDLFRTAPEGLLDVGRGEVAYRRVGSGPDVLFVNGFPVSGATFRTLLPFLAPHVTCHVIDLPGTGSSRFDIDAEPPTDISFDGHVETVRRVVDLLGLDDVAVVGHDSGGLITRMALAGDARVRAMGLIDTEQPQGLTWRFRSFLLARHLPGFATVFGVLAGNRVLRRSSLVLGGAFVDRTLLDGQFDEFFLRPLAEDRARRIAATRLLRSFDPGVLRELPEVHGRIDVPVQLVWGRHDPFFPVGWAEEMVGTFPNASLAVIDDAALFAHEERPAEVAAALLPVLTG